MLIIQNISKHISLDKKEEEYFLSLLKEHKIKKRQFLLHENEVAKHIAFVTKGCLRSYSIDNKGFEHILQFAPVDWWIGDISGFISEKKVHLTLMRSKTQKSCFLHDMTS